MKVNIYGKIGCGACVSAKQLCESKKIEHQYLSLGKDYDLTKFMSLSNSHKSFPLITVIDNDVEKYLGGLHQLQQVLNGDNL